MRVCCVCLRQPYFLGDGIYVVYTGVDIPYYGCVGAYLVIYVLLYINMLINLIFCTLWRFCAIYFSLLVKVVVMKSLLCG